MGRSSLPASLWTLVALTLSAYAGLTAEQQAASLLALFPLPDFLSIPLAQQGEARIVHTLTGVIGGFLTFFALGYLLPAFWDALRLGWVNADLSSAYNRKRFQDVNRPPLSEKWFIYPLFNRLWRDFAETLHPQTSPESDQVTYRATAPAELYFNHQVLVDTPMRVEFFRHLPGILTGAGIVSTFAGILLGLTEFDPMVGPDEVTSQLKNLFLGVSTAFVASFFAIFTAIAVTVVEKLLLQWRYAQVTLLQGRVDDLFRGGVESEYLAQLVQGQDLSLISQRLEVILEHLTTRTIGAASTDQDNLLPSMVERLVTEINTGNTERMAHLTQTLHNSLVTPLQGIAHSMNAILAIHEAQQTTGGSLVHQMDLALERSSTINEGIDKVREELIQQGEKSAALSERTTSLLIGQLTKAVQEIAASSQESSKVLAIRELQQATESSIERVREELVQQGEKSATLSERTTTLLVNELAKAVQDIAASSQESSKVLAIHEAQRALGDEGILQRMDQALERSSAISSGIEKVREELVQQGEKTTAASERSTNLLVNELTKALRESLAKTQESAKERDAFLLARMTAGHGELLERVKENLEASIAAGLAQPVESILDKVQAVREEQADAHRTLTDAILEAFAHHLRESVTLLVSQMEGLGGRLAEERKAMEASFDRLSANILQAAQEGGDNLAHQMKMALATAENRQDGLLEVLTKISGEMRGDINLLAQQITQSGKEVTSILTEQSLELAAQADEATQRLLKDAVGGSSQELKETLRTLAEEQFRRERERDATLLQRMDFASANIAKQLRDSLQETEQERLQREQETEAKQEARTQQYLTKAEAMEQARLQQQQALEQERRTREQAMTTEIKSNISTISTQLSEHIREFLLAELQRSNATLDTRIGTAETRQQALTREMTDALMTAMASKMENTFGGLANGLSELQVSFDDERQTIEKALKTWADDLAHVSREGADVLAQEIRQVMTEAENRHKGVLEVLNEFSENIGSRMGRIHDGILEKGTETISRLDRVEGSIERSNDDRSRQIAAMAQEIQERSKEAAASLSQHVDEVVTSTSQEQSIFIEALSERLDTLRKRLNISK